MGLTGRLSESPLCASAFAHTPPPGTPLPPAISPFIQPSPAQEPPEPDPHQTLGTASPNSWGQAYGDTVGQGSLWGTFGPSYPWLLPHWDLAPDLKEQGTV